VGFAVVERAQQPPFGDAIHLVVVLFRALF
jgi:hypothetical protein